MVYRKSILLYLIYKILFFLVFFWCRAVSRQQTANQRTTPMTVCRSCGGLPNGESTLQIIRLTALQEYFIREYRYRRFRWHTISNTIEHKESPLGKIRVGIRFKAPFVADC